MDTETTIDLRDHPGLIFDTIEDHHRAAHSCEGRWWNPNAGARQNCPTMTATTVLRGIMGGLLVRVHAAAHDDETVAHVASAMLSTPLAELDPEQRDAWLMLARLAIEGLSERLGPDSPEQAAANLAPRTS